MKILSVRLSDQDQAEIERLSAATGKTPSGIVKEALGLFARSAGAKTPAELARKHGLVGCFEGPKDLSRNARRHLKRRIRARHSR
jgi:hypothetical protein